MDRERERTDGKMMGGVKERGKLLGNGFSGDSDVFLTTASRRWQRRGDTLCMLRKV